MAGCWAEKGLVTATSMARPLPSTPVLDRHVSRAAARGRAQDALLLEHWREHALICNVCNHVAKSVVAGDAISCLCAASGVVAIRVDGLRAQRARDFIGEERDA